MKNKLSVKQNGFRDCASACLLSIIKYYGGNLTLEEISYLIKTDVHGTNAYNLIEGAKKIGFDGYGIKTSFKELLKCNNWPVIAHVKQNNMYHYVVIYGLSKSHIKVMDPAFGIKKVKLSLFEKDYLGTILIIKPVKEIPKMLVKDKLINKIINTFILNRKLVLKIIILSVFVTLFNIIINFYLKVYIDYVYNNFNKSLLVNITICFLLIVFLKSIFDNIRDKVLADVKYNISSNITNCAINHIMNLPYHYIKNKPSGEVISRLDDLDNFKELSVNVVLNVFVNIFLVIGSIAILILLNKSLFFISVITILIFILVAFIYSHVFKNKIYDVQAYNGEYKKDLCELINSYETLKNLNLIQKFCYKINIKFNGFLNKIKDFEYSYSNERMFKNIISEASIIVISALGLLFVYKNLITIGDLVAFTSLLMFFTEPIKELISLIPSYKYAVNSYDRINDLLLIKKEEINNMNHEKIHGNVQIKNLSYSYNNIDSTLENININIEKNSKLLLFGKSGSGKSTLMKILLGYISEYKGSIYINNRNIKDIGIDVLRNSITYVSQNEVLLNDTIKNNIIMQRNISDKNYNETSKICKVDEIINKKQLRNNFLIEENGFNLSGGERQKIILARGLLKECNILILDEALSEVGFIEEKEIIKEILKKYEKKTVIYISHKKEILKSFKNKYFFSKKGEKNVIK